jgi:hypothetical protein
MAKKNKTSGKRKSKASSNDATTTGNKRRRGKRKAEKSGRDIMISVLAEHQVLDCSILSGLF